jgi:segregation and condensation protein A
MDNPIFKLDSVVQERNEETLQDFEGPLDLILSLLAKNKIEIQNIPIALLLEQYQDYLEQRRRLDLEIASEFIIMAAHLMYIKTRMLVSLEDAMNELDALKTSLKERQDQTTYRRIRLLTDTMAEMSEFGRNTMTRNPEPVEHGAVYVYDHSPEDLLAAMKSIATRTERMAPPDSAAFRTVVHREPYSVKDKAREIIERLKTSLGITRFLLLFRGSRSRSEIVATFIAVLELCRGKYIRLAGSDVDCTVKYEKDAPETLAF